MNSKRKINMVTAQKMIKIQEIEVHLLQEKLEMLNHIEIIALTAIHHWLAAWKENSRLMKKYKKSVEK